MVPKGEGAVATFGVSNVTDVKVSRPGDTVDRIIFTSTAGAYTLAVGERSALGSRLTFSGLGIVNDSGLTQSFIPAASTIEFKNSSNAGVGCLFTVASPSGLGTDVVFYDTSSAGSATFDVHKFANGVSFYDDSTAGSATFTTGDISSISFIGNSTAENATLTVNGAHVFGFGGHLFFVDNATGGSAQITLKRGTASSARGGLLAFANNSSAGHATMTAEGGSLDIAQSATITFTETATAGEAVFTLESALQSGGTGAILTFENSSSAGNGVLVANSGTGSDTGGVVKFVGTSTGSTARVELLGPVSGGGTLDIDNYGSSSVTVGSIEGGGLVVLGSKNLTVGTNNLSTTFSGLIRDTGSITKIGTGTLTLTGANTYSGGTTIERGILLVSNISGSGTGTGAVSVNAGTLGGSGIIAGAVTVGTNSGAGAFLAPSKGIKKPATLTIQGALTLNDDSTYIYNLETRRVSADEVIANGVTIDNGAKFSLRPSGTMSLTLGQVFTVISNTSANPIVGTFHNLTDGRIITSTATISKPATPAAMATISR